MARDLYGIWTGLSLTPSGRASFAMSVSVPVLVFPPQPATKQDASTAPQVIETTDLDDILSSRKLHPTIRGPAPRA